jgi:hypothetical protein
MPVSTENMDAWLEDYRRRHGGLTPAGVHYRKVHGIPLYVDKGSHGRGRMGPRKPKLLFGNPGNCLEIHNGHGRPEPCILCGATNPARYEVCLDWADKNHWWGWVI